MPDENECGFEWDEPDDYDGWLTSHRCWLGLGHHEEHECNCGATESV